ncbi:MAG: amidohydrolase family protein, partial [Kiritimatiellae bacterium]|nr:amidohydrolase family protein [Kiritimatiellia bacterium]
MRTLIENGFIVDGTGGPGFRGCVVIEGDRIADIFEGSVPTSSEGSVPTGTRAAFDAVVDADGRMVTPGFIDAHSHSDAYLVVEPDAPSKLSQGITTEINGQCGGSVAPRYGEARLSGDWASILGDRLTWRSLAEYRDVLSAAKPSINTVQFIGHNTLRSSVVGYAGRNATTGELAQMERILARELSDGGWGLTTGLIYQPGKYSTSEEVVALAKVASSCGGFYATHMRSEGDRILESIDEVVELVKATGIRAEISHLKTSGRRNWGKIDQMLEKMQSAVDSGLLLGSDRYPFCAAGTDLDVVFPDWAGEGAAPAEMERLRDPELRARIISDIDASGRDWSEVMVGGVWHEDNKPYSGRTIADICGGRTPGETVCDILEKDLCRTGAFFFGMSEENLDRIYAMPWVLPGSDASLRAPWGPLGEDHPHPRAYGTMPEFFCRLTDRRKSCAVSDETAISRMTSAVARRFGIKERGVLERGAFADIAVWRRDDFRNTATYDRSHSFCTGMEKVFVNGALAYDGGTFTRSGTGRFLER